MNTRLLFRRLVTQIQKTLTSQLKPSNNELIQTKDLQEKELPYSTRFYEHEDKTLTRFDNAYFLYLEQEIKDQKYRDEEEDLK